MKKAQNANNDAFSALCNPLIRCEIFGTYLKNLKNFTILRVLKTTSSEISCADIEPTNINNKTKLIQKSTLFQLS